MGYALKQNCAQGCPQTCGSLPTPTISCVSKNGSASLTGWSKLANFNSGDWNTRKYNRVTYTATSLYDASQRVWTDAACTVGQADSAWRQLHLSDETAGLVEDFGGPLGKRVARHIYSCVGGVHIIGTSFLAPFAIDGADGAIESGRITTDTTDQVTASQSSTSCQNITFSPTLCFSTTYNSRHLQEGFTRTTNAALSIPTTVHRVSSGTAGTACRTTAGSIAATTSGSTSAIAITSTITVRTTFACTGLTNGTSYTLSFTETQYSPGTSTVLNAFPRTAVFTATGSTTNVDYDNVVNTDGDYECSAPSVVPT